MPGCRKGKRECIYPDPDSNKSTRDSSKPRLSTTDEIEGSSDDDYDEDADAERLPRIPDDEDVIEGDVSAASILGPRAFNEHDSMSPSVKAMSPTDVPSGRPSMSSRTASRQTIKRLHLPSTRWSHLPKDIRFYFKYHRDHISHHHYAIKYDRGDFLKTTFLDIALGYEPLLFAVTAFSAYFHALSSPDGKINNFLYYYSKSVNLLRQSLSKSPKHSVATLLTILQLASFEVRTSVHSLM